MLGVFVVDITEAVVVDEEDVDGVVEVCKTIDEASRIRSWSFWLSIGLVVVVDKLTAVTDAFNSKLSLFPPK